MSENYEKNTPIDEIVDEPENELPLTSDEEAVVQTDASDEISDETETEETEVEIDIEDIEQEDINPELSMTTGQKVKVLLMKPLWSSITKWVFIFLGIVGMVLYFIAGSSRSTGEAFSKAFSGVCGGIASFFSLIPIPMFEILICATIVGILAYLVYIIVRTVQVKGAFHKGGLWVQFGYTLLAVAGVFALLMSMCYGVFSYRERLSKSTDYSSADVTNMEFAETMLYLIDNVNNTLYDGSDSIFFRKNNLSQYQQKGSAIEAITEKVCEAFEAASDDIPTLKGKKLKAKELLFSPLYSKYQISSIYSPFTAEICMNTDYPEIFVPMQVAKTIAMQRGYTDDGTADFIAFLVCTQYTDDYYLNYSGYFNAYLELSSQFYKTNGKDLHLYLANALHHNAKKEYVQVVKELDELYNISSDIAFVDAQKSLNGSEYCDVSKLLLVSFRDLVEEGTVDVDDIDYVDFGNYCNYLTNFYKIDEDFQYDVIDTYDEYHSEY